MTRRAAQPVDLTLEREIQRDVIDLHQQVGCEVVVFTQYGRTGSGTHQTPGVADLKIYCRRKRLTWWFEAKTPTGVQSAAQQRFQALVEACGETYILGGEDAALAHLRAIGLIA